MDRTAQRRLATLSGRLEDLIGAGAVEEAVKGLVESLSATRRVRCPRDRGEPVSYEDLPDWPTRMAAAKTLIEFRHGKAKQQVTLSTNDEAGRQQGRDEVLHALAQDWERTRRIAESWIEGVKRAETPAVVEVPSLAGSRKSDAVVN